jgi:hypothetical protein
MEKAVVGVVKEIRQNHWFASQIMIGKAYRYCSVAADCDLE